MSWEQNVKNVAQSLNVKLSKVNLYSAGREELIVCISSLVDKGRKPIVILFDAKQSREISKILNKLNISHVVLNDLDVLPFETLEPSRESISSRTEALNDLLSKEKVVVADVMSILKRTAPPSSMMESRIFSVGGKIPEGFAEWLVKRGYTRVMTVRSVGEFSVRGNIIDIFSPKFGAVRVETFDRDIESIRIFDPETQLSTTQLREVRILPFFELLREKKSIEMAKERLLNSDHPELLSEPAERLQGMAGLFWKDPHCGIDYVDEDDYMVIYETEKCKEKYEEYEREIFELYDNSFRPLYKKFSYAPFERLRHAKEIHVSKVPLGMPFDDSYSFSTNVSIPSVSEGHTPNPFSFISNEFSEIKIGDLVVHSDHGIGIYEGTQIIKDLDGEHEYLRVRYRHGALLYVPVEKFVKINKYVGSAERTILSDINGKEWRKTKERVKTDIESEINSMLDLYARREESRGFSFSPNTELEGIFAKSFEYMETVDQSRALEDVFNDMISEKPMDRLICGDTGFGKTEVALRAAFRAVVNGKQVVLLAPTTVLARQHYLLFHSRMDPFGIKVMLLSSQSNASEKRKVLEEMSDGKADVIIGTHALLTPKLSFKDLGLIIVDEEQRFGTKQKEFLKKMRLNVDILTLAATPIPRTLHMALSGIRTMSVIQTPPIGRTTPKIYVAKWNEKIIQSAILREISRGGQIFYVHNRVVDLKRISEKLMDLLPSTKIAYIHGRMPKKSFMKTIDDFYQSKIDVLIATSVVENGVDVPNANTLIIDDVERYGLGQLYQLKGRVGRSNKRAFVYLMYFKEPSHDVSERLKALTKFSNPGSAMELALKDMEIRGVGEVIGLRQHGHIDSVGLYMYREMLKQTITKLRNGKEAEGEQEVDIELPSSVLASEYVPDPLERMKLYRRLASSKNIEEIRHVIEEMLDRFGPIPNSAKKLLDHSKIRALALNLNVESLKKHGENVEMIFRSRKALSNFTRFYKEGLTNPSKNVMILRDVIVENDLEKLLRILLDYKNSIAPTKEGVS